MLAIQVNYEWNKKPREADCGDLGGSLEVSGEDDLKELFPWAWRENLFVESAQKRYLLVSQWIGEK